MALPFRHLISADQLTPEIANEIFDLADYMQRICNMKGRIDLLSDKIIGLLFFEASSRTILSFQSAAQRLQAGVIFAQGKESSSLKKRETIRDTVMVTAGYCDLLVMRHEAEGAAKEATARQSATNWSRTRLNWKEPLQIPRIPVAPRSGEPSIKNR